MLDFEQAFADKKRASYSRPVQSRKAVIRSTFPRYAARHANRDDAEMGFLPMLASVIPLATNLVGSLFGKKSSKTGQPPPEAGIAKQVLDALTQAGVGTGGEKSLDIKEIVRNIVSTVPSPVIAQVKAAIAEMKDKTTADQSARDLIADKIDIKFQPQITALLASLRAQKLQTQATSEHKNLKAKEAFRTGTTTSLNQTLLSLQNLSKRLSAIEQRLQTSAVISSQQRMALLGGKSVIEG